MEVVQIMIRKFSNNMAQMRRILFLLNFLTVLLSCSLMLNIHYSPDTYCIWFVSDNDYIRHFYNSRFVSGVLYKLLAAVGINVARSQSVFTLGFMLCVAGVCTALTRRAAALLQVNGKTGTMALIGADAAFLLIFNNAFISEWYIFGECMPMYGVAIVCAIWSALSYVRILGEERKSAPRRIAVSLLALTLSLGCYQVCIGIYVSLLLIFVYIHRERSVKQRILYAGGGLTLGAVGCVLNVVIAKILAAFGVVDAITRGMTQSPQMIWENIRSLWRSQPDLWSGTQIYPAYVLPIFFLGALAALLWFALRHHAPAAETALAVGFAVCIYLGSFIPHYVTTDFWLSIRTLVPLIGVFSFLILALLANDASFPARRFAACFAGVFLLCNALLMQDIFSNHLASDADDTAYAQDIQACITEYTEETGEEICALAFAKDSAVSYFYDGVDYVTHELNIKNITVTWSDVQLINAANGTSYERAEMDEAIWAEYFEGRNWDSFDPEEQIVFQNHTAYIVLY